MHDVLDQITTRGERSFAIAPKSKRLGNYLLDYIGFYAMSMGFGLLLGFLLMVLPVDFLEQWIDDDGSGNFWAFDLVFGIILSLSYYTCFEYFTQGKSLGKLVTRTRAVRLDNEPLTFRDALLRSAIRMIPFEAFSFLREENTGWHDMWTDTKVILDQDWK
ncbi:RDD family protein [Lewinella sp. W8]|uniref:RDD family protein n=1 Tax=Lewinella sp. W8 TaxID=2528208 RepID=UPI001067A45C|nr:RDD family protein [Lewinella sp. W8]MTB52115.1 hypothetical protein [Lewinella sp. W8]